MQLSIQKFRKQRKIQFQIEEKDQKVLLHIKDNGIGIPEQDVKRIFDPFFTGVNGRKTREATGMGLYITKEICDNLHHGMYVQSAEGKGQHSRSNLQKMKNIIH